MAALITSCSRHAFANAHTAAMALRYGAPLVRGSAARCAEELTTRALWPMIVRGTESAVSPENKSYLFDLLRKSEENLIRKLMKR